MHCSNLYDLFRRVCLIMSQSVLIRVVTYITICFWGSISCYENNLHGRLGEGYMLEVMVGSPPQNFNVLVDTGSTNFAVAAAQHQDIDRYFNSSKSSSVVNSDDLVSVMYMQGSWSGKLASDFVYFPTLNSVPKVRCDIALITNSEDFFIEGSNWQGILGIAYPAVSKPNPQVLSWIDSLQISNGDKTMGFSLTLCGRVNSTVNKHFGSFEILNNVMHKYENLITAPVIKDRYYEIIITSLSVDDKRLDMNCKDFNLDKSIVDSGTTNLRLPKKPLLEMVAKISTIANKTGALIVKSDFWYKRRVSCWPQEQDWNMLPRINIDIASSNTDYFTLSLPGMSYVRQVYDPSRRVREPNEEPEFCYKFAIGLSEKGIILGAVVMEGFEVIFNRTGRTVGFRKATCGPPVNISGPFRSNRTDLKLLEGCIYLEDRPVSMLSIAAYIVCTLLVIVSILFAYLFVQWLKEKYFRCHAPVPSVSLCHTSLITEDS